MLVSENQEGRRVVVCQITGVRIGINCRHKINVVIAAILTIIRLALWRMLGLDRTLSMGATARQHNIFVKLYETLTHASITNDLRANMQWMRHNTLYHVGNDFMRRFPNGNIRQELRYCMISQNFGELLRYFNRFKSVLRGQGWL